MTILLTHAPFWVLQVVVGLFWCLGMRLSAASLDELETLLVEAFVDAMHRAHLSFKEMAYAMRRGEQDTFDEAQLRRQLAREKGQHLSLFRLLGAPLSWWVFFGPTLMAIVFRRRWQEMRDELDAMRADVVKVATGKRTAA
jgi:hypothetical protein